jgi:hypothetical protein
MTFKPIPERFVYVPKGASPPIGTNAAKDPNGLEAMLWQDDWGKDGKFEFHSLDDTESVTDGTFEVIAPHRELRLWLPTSLAPQERQQVLDTFTNRYTRAYEQSDRNWTLTMLACVFLLPTIVLVVGRAVLWVAYGFRAAKP